MELDLAASILNQEGLPLAWVPREKIVSSMLHTPDREARLQVLIENRDEVLDDCYEALNHITHPYLQRQLPLGRKVIAALKAGFDEPAQALAVTVTDAAVSMIIGGSKDLARDGYKSYKELVELDFDKIQVPYELVRQKQPWLLSAPFMLLGFLTKMDPNQLNSPVTSPSTRPIRTTSHLPMHWWP